MSARTCILCVPFVYNLFLYCALRMELFQVTDGCHFWTRHVVLQGTTHYCWKEEATGRAFTQVKLLVPQCRNSNGAKVQRYSHQNIPNTYLMFILPTFTLWYILIKNSLIISVYIKVWTRDLFRIVHLTWINGWTFMTCESENGKKIMELFVCLFYKHI